MKKKLLINDNSLILLLENISISKNNIKKIIRVKKGLTNKIYKVYLKNGVILKVRISNKQTTIDRNLEYKIEKNLDRDFIYYNKENGDYIAYWINGKNPNWFYCKKTTFWISIISSINDFRRLNNNIDIKFEKESLLADFSIMNNNDLNHMYTKYLLIINNFNNDNTIISHTDISRLNIIKTTNNKYEIIDFEWVNRLHKYWDIANLIKDFNLSYNAVLKLNLTFNYILKELIDIIFAVHFYTFVWTFKIKPISKKILKYREKMLKKSKYWFNKAKIQSIE